MNCANCGEETHFSPVVAIILLFAPALKRPYPLIPGEEYTHCTKCDAIFKFVVQAAEAHPATREATVGPWTRAVVLYDDGEGSEVHPNRPAEIRA